MSEFRITLTGGAETAQLLSVLPDRIRDNAMRGAVLQGARIIRDDARSRVHIGAPPLPRGRKPRDLWNAIMAALNRTIGDVVSASAGVTAAGFWGRFVEFGTAAKAGRLSSRGRRRSIRAHHATRAYPFMRPAADESAAAAAQAVVNYAGARVIAAALSAGVLSEEDLG